MAASVAGHRVKTSLQHRKRFVLHRSDESKVRGWPQLPEHGAGLPWLYTRERSRGPLAKPCGTAAGAAGGPIRGSARSRLCPHRRGQEVGAFPTPSPLPWAWLPCEPPTATEADSNQGSRRAAGRRAAGIYSQAAAVSEVVSGLRGAIPTQHRGCGL